MISKLFAQPTPPPYPVPDEDSIIDAAAEIREKLSDPRIEELENVPYKEGYQAALSVLVTNQTTYGGACELPASMQGRAIATLAVDYLNGREKPEIMLGAYLTERQAKEVLKRLEKQLRQDETQ